MRENSIEVNDCTKITTMSRMTIKKFAQIFRQIHTHKHTYTPQQESQTNSKQSAQVKTNIGAKSATL